MIRSKYWVVWSNSIDKWQVKKTGSEKALKNFKTKKSSISYGVGVAQKNTPSQLIIKRKDGTIEDERTYGEDPYPPRG